MENIFFDVDQLTRPSRTEQARGLDEAERPSDDVQRAAANDPATLELRGSTATKASVDAAPNI